jgi:hypothetical protein
LVVGSEEWHAAFRTVEDVLGIFDFAEAAKILKGAVLEGLPAFGTGYGPIFIFFLAGLAVFHGVPPGAGADPSGEKKMGGIARAMPPEWFGRDVMNFLWGCSPRVRFEGAWGRCG